ncbi:DUF2637 domain-containing protein [Pseudonocardia sp.]|uniref:DUF2637 domain-containing protein n=1 Tax=Pseudonocardia sp. TaxID=60912 RepID=UPI003D12F2BD
MSRPAGRRWVAIVAILGTAVIGVGAFWLSFRALSDLASRAGIPGELGWVWATIVDGVIVTSTVAAVALDKSGWRAVWFAWLLLALSAAVSVMANIVHAILGSGGSIDAILVGAIAAVPPLVLLAMTHLTVVVVRHARPIPEPLAGPVQETDIDLPDFLAQTFPPRPAISPPQRPRRPKPAALPSTADLRDRAEELRSAGLSNSQIARELGVHKSTVGRWFLPDTSEVNATEEDSDE